HIVSDGWSLGVMVRELGVLYEAALRGEPAALPELRIQYPDFSVWQRRWLDGPVLDGLLAYWRGRLAGELPLLDLPADRPRPAVRSGRGGLRPVYFSEQRTAGLRAVARNGGATLFMTLLAAFQTLIHRYTGQRDVLVGSPVANREALETEALIGCFINTLVLRGRPAPDRPFAALLAELRDETLGAYDHQSLPFERLVEELAPGRDRGRNPLFEVLLVLQNAPMPPLQLRDLRLALEEIDGGTTKLDLTLRLEERGAALAGMLEYDADLFEAATADRILGHFETLLAGIAEGPGLPLEALPLLTAAERLELAAWNDTGSAASAAGAAACLHELVAARVQRSPDSEAVVADVDGHTVRWTAAELNARANRLAHRLRALGIQPEERVGVCLRRTPSLIAALLGVLKAGGAYVPLDPAYPQDRLAFMLADSGARVVLTEEALSGRLSFFAGRVIRLDAGPAGGRDAEEIAQFRDSDPALLPGAHPLPDNLAYLIYTSGSTGRPKGVAIEHRSAAVMVRWAAEVFPPEDLAGALASTSVCFDLSVFEIFVPLAAGGRVILADNALALPALSAASEVTLINTVPSAIAELVRSGGLPPSVRTVNLAGEPLKAALVEQIYAGSRAERVLNLYGPSEDTTYSTYALVPRGTAAVSIGVPLAGSRVHLLGSSWAEPAPVGVPGELCLAGDGLARGYLGRPDLTAERFVPDPFGGLSGQGGKRLYRTGDLARWRDDGQLDFLGRLDHQVKVRGFRIELGEIEEVLAHHPSVKEVVVVAREDLSIGKALVAYVVPRESWVLEAWGLGACDLGEGEGAAPGNANGHHEPDLAITLRGFLKTRLPEYMVPSFFVELPELPLTPNGKVDRKALPLPGTAGGGAERVLPRGAVEEQVAGLWAQVLGLPEDAEIGVFDSFFDLGGHSLLATQLVSRLREAFEIEMPLARLFETPTVAGLSRRVEEARAAAAGTAPLMRPVPHPLGQPLPLSFAQERLWFLDRMQPGAAYNLPLAIHLTGGLDPARLSAVFEEIVRRHETLRTTFPEHDGDPVQVVGPPFAWELPLVDLTGVSGAYGRALALAREEALRPFDLTGRNGGPLLRTTLIRLAADDHLLAFNMHHIVSDGWSLGVLLEEVAALYGASLAGEPSPLPELPVQYADFALWQRDWLRGEELERQMGFWRRQLEGATALLELPTDRPRPQVQSSRGAWQPVSLPGELVRDLGFGRRQGVTLFMVLLAAWQTLLFRYTGQRDLSVGSPIAGRNRGETERLIGFFVNTLVMRGDLSGNPTFEELLARVRRVALAAYAHQDLPFEKLVEELKPVRDMSHQPLFQVMLTLQNAPLGKMALPGLSLTPVEVGSSGSKFDLTLVLTEETDGVHGQLEYNTDLFDATTAARLAGHFRVLLEAIAESPRQTVAAVPLLTLPERHQLLTEWSEAHPEPFGPCVHHLLERQAGIRPRAVACVHEQESWTYAELNRRANRMAGYLRGRGIGLESRVGLYVERDLGMLAAMFGVLKAGAAYLPFDSAFLGERLAFALQDAEVPILLTQERMMPKLAALDLPGVEIVRLDADWEAIEAGGSDENPGWPVDDLNTAYVIYTSGSTGTPKGVTVPHRGVVAYTEASADIFQVTPEDRNLQFSSISFDASVEEIYTCLARGATLVVRGEAQEGVSEFLRRVEDYGITVMQVPTAYFHQMAAAMETEGLPFPPKLRRLIAGGERILPQRLVSWWKRAPERLRFVNGYGPTETTVAVTMCCFPGPVAIDERLNEVPLGYPLRYVHAYVVDRWMQPVPVGVSGELLIGGVSLARGYLRRPDLTADRFIPNPFAPVGGEPGDRLYRTGDLVRSLPNGMLEFLGRLDDQVKVRGFRIELGEIEAVLSRHGGVREAVVLARDDGAGGGGGDKRLVAYVSTQGEPGPTVAELREFLERHLPAYMVPSALLVLPALPMNVHGKVDRKALPDPRVVQAPQRAEYVAPAGELEEKIAEAWRELFGLDQVGVHDNFFDSGGNSLLIVKLHSRLQKVLGREFPLVEIFQHPTISALAASLGAGAAGEPQKPSVAVQARARTDTRRESMRQLQERRGQRRNQRNER
ncbi:MAG TPA: amino acid adenylation domain-containing protein, partial [Thermoanaerobaculia bacterium]|nr:amino acid adenylation domain-containing protein [Thermoanaerobaculia bacterium]